MDLYVGKHTCGLRVGTETPPIWLHGQEPAVAVQCLLQPLQRKQTWFGPRLRVWLAGSLARPFMMQPVAGLQSRAEVDLLVAQAAREAGMDWSEPVFWLSDSLLRQSTVAVASDRGQLRQLLGAVEEAGLRAKQISPWWRLALDETLRLSKSCEVLLVEDTDGLAWLHSRGGNWSAADYRAYRTRGRDGTTGAHALAMQPPASDLADPEQEAWIARRAFAAGIEPTSVRHVALDADAPQAAAGWPAPTLRGAET